MRTSLYKIDYIQDTETRYLLELSFQIALPTLVTCLRYVLDDDYCGLGIELNFHQLPIIFGQIDFRFN